MLYIIKENSFWADYILNPLDGRENIVFLRYARVKYQGAKKIAQCIIRFARAILFNKKGLWSNWFFTADFLKELKRIGPHDRVLMFSCQNLKELLVLNKEIDCAAKSVFLWNPLATVNKNFYSKWEYARYLHATEMRICTFDECDARTYRFELVNQVYRKPRVELSKKDFNIDNEVFFVARDKRRSKQIANILNALELQKVTHEFYILRDKHTEVFRELLPYYMDRQISYDYYLMRLVHAKCLLEVLQPDQSGMTIRTLEALFFGKKLITTNSGIKHSDIYHPDNIFVLDGTENRTIKEFLGSDLHEFSQEIVERYDIEYWIKQFE